MKKCFLLLVGICIALHSCQTDEIFSPDITDTITVAIYDYTNYQPYSEEGLQITLKGGNISITKDVDSLGRCVFNKIPPGTYTALTLIRDSVKLSITGIQSYGLNEIRNKTIIVYEAVRHSITDFTLSKNSNNASLLTPQVIFSDDTYTTSYIIYASTTPNVSAQNASWQYIQYTTDLFISTPDHLEVGTTLYFVAYPIYMFDTGNFNYETGFTNFTSIGAPSAIQSIIIQ